MRALPWLALIACNGPATDGPRWRSTTYPTTVPDPVPVPPTPTDTAPPLPTGPTGPTADTGIGRLCKGEGPASLEMGSGGRATFDPFDVGDTLQIERGINSNDWGISLEALSTGLDTRGDMSVVVRIQTSQIDTTYIGILRLQCNTPGPGWTAMEVDFADSYQNAAGAGLFDGEVANVDLTMTDLHNNALSTDLDMVLRGP